MLNIKNVSLHSLGVALRWVSIYGTRRYGFPSKVEKLTEEQSNFIQKLCEECDARQENLPKGTVVRFHHRPE